MKLYAAIDNHDFSEDICFLCGATLTPENRSSEHVFPKWVQGKYDLWNQRITLLNGTSIPYRQLMIPCCSVCNNNVLSQVEDRVQLAVEQGYAAVAKLDTHTLFLWLGKIFFGMLYRELFLPIDRSAPDSVAIVSPDDMAAFQMHHYFLQSCRVQMEFECFDAEYPWTIYIFQMQELAEQRANWDFHDDINCRTVFVRMGNIGMLAAFDAGAISVDAGNAFSRYSEYSLHPLQFEELGAAFFYKASLFDRTPKFVVTETDGLCKVMVMPVAGLSRKPVFKEWNPNSYAKVLSIFTGASIEQILPEPGKVMTWLRRQEDNEFMRIDIENVPYRGYS